MPRRLGVPISILLAILPFPARACECRIVYPIRREVRSTDAVFMGVAGRVQPKYLEYWRLANGAPKLPLEKLSRLRSQGALEELRALYLELSGDLPMQERTQLENAPTLRELEDSFNSIASGGVRTRFKVLKRYKLPQGDDDEEPESDDFTTVWSDSGDCDAPGLIPHASCGPAAYPRSPSGKPSQGSPTNCSSSSSGVQSRQRGRVLMNMPTACVPASVPSRPEVVRPKVTRRLPCTRARHKAHAATASAP